MAPRSKQLDSDHYGQEVETSTTDMAPRVEERSSPRKSEHSTRGRGRPQTARKIQRNRSSSLSAMDRGKIANARQKYLEAMKDSNEKGIYSRAEQTQVGQIEIEPTVAVPKRGVQRTRSRSLTQLDQRTRPGGRRSSWIKQPGGTWRKPTATTVASAKVEEKPKVEPAGPVKSARGRPRYLKPQRTRSRSLTARTEKPAAIPKPIVKPPSSSKKPTPTKRRVQRQRSRSLTAIRRQTASDGTTRSVLLAYDKPNKWTSLKTKSAIKMQAVVRGFVARRRWILQKPRLQKQQIQRLKEKELRIIEHNKQSALLGLLYEHDELEYQRSKQLKTLKKEKAGLEKQIQLQKDTKQYWRIELQKQKAEAKRWEDRSRTNANVTMLHTTTVSGLQQDHARTQKRLKSYQKQVAVVQRELEDKKLQCEQEKQRRQDIVKGIKDIFGKLQQGNDADRKLVEFLVKYSGISV